MELSSEILSQLVIYAKYAKYLPNKKRRETWEEIVDRNMNMHIRKFPDLELEIRDAYKLVYDKVVLPSLRAMQFSGKPIEINPVRQFNCSATAINSVKVFSEIMFLLLSGSGVGISVQKHHVEQLPPVRHPLPRRRRFLVGDSIEGWADAVKVLMEAYFYGKSDPEYDYRDIRPKGSPLKTAGGKAPGPGPLKDCIHNLRKVLDRIVPGEKLRPLDAHDIVCHISDAVLSGGIRRSSIISFFSLDDEEMLTCKSGDWFEKNPQRGRANNSAVILRHRIKKQNFMALWERIRNNGTGEPSVFFSNSSESLANPCSEASLNVGNGGQMCNLCEINASAIETQRQLNAAAAAAAFIGTLQASYTDFHYLGSFWKKMVEKEALLGIGITGLANENFLKLDLRSAAEICVQENRRLAKAIGIKPAARITLVKPSGTSSLVLATSSGIHCWHDRFYIRRLRFNKDEPLYQYVKRKIPELVEDDFEKPSLGAVVSIPIKAPDGAILRPDETALQLLERVKYINQNWIAPGHISGNNMHNVSCTVSLRENEWDEVGLWLWKNREFYNGIAVLPYFGGNYKQMPLESITQEKYEEMFSLLTKFDLSEILEEEDRVEYKSESACSGGACEISQLIGN
jgi:ribonucleoside-diphosphate reductase alpha chain